MSSNFCTQIQFEKEMKILKFKKEESMMGLLSVIEPATVDEALSDDGWILTMQEELNQFQRNHV